MTDLSQCLRAYAVGDEDVTDGSVENYDFDWGEPVASDAALTSYGCQGGSRLCPWGCQTSCGGCDTEPEPEPDPEPEPAPEPTENCPTWPCGRCGCKNTAADGSAYPIVDL